MHVIASKQPSGGCGADLCVVLGAVMVVIGLAVGLYGIFSKNLTAAAAVAAGVGLVLGAGVLWAGLAMDETFEEPEPEPELELGHDDRA